MESTQAEIFGKHAAAAFEMAENSMSLLAKQSTTVAVASFSELLSNYPSFWLTFALLMIIVPQLTQLTKSVKRLTDISRNQSKRLEKLEKMVTGLDKKVGELTEVLEDIRKFCRGEDSEGEHTNQSHKRVAASDESSSEDSDTPLLSKRRRVASQKSNMVLGSEDAEDLATRIFSNSPTRGRFGLEVTDNGVPGESCNPNGYEIQDLNGEGKAVHAVATADRGGDKSYNLSTTKQDMSQRRSKSSSGITIPKYLREDKSHAA
jgi:hypothetical protein